MGDRPVIISGVLGWGNRKTGLEAYGPGGRWGGPLPAGRTEGRGYGDLLGDALDRLGLTEGAQLVVVAFPSRFDGDAARDLCARLADELDTDGWTGVGDA